MPDRIQFRRDIASNWRTFNPTLAQGEPAYETDARLLKIGDGVTAWNTLPYVNRPDSGIAGGRLSINQGVPVNLPNPGAFNNPSPTILYYVPYTSNLITLWSNGIGWRTRPFDTNTAISLVGLPGNTNYDVFAQDVNGTVQLSLAAWADNWTRAGLTGCGSTGIVRFEGVMVQCGDVTKRYLGTIRTSAAGGSTHDNFWRRFVFNHTNQVLTSTLWYHGITHTFEGNYWRRWDNGSYGDATQAAQAADKIQIVMGAPGNIFVKLNSYLRFGNVAAIMYGSATQLASPAAWNGVQPLGNFTGYAFDQTNAANAVFSMNSCGTVGRQNTGLVEFWIAEYGRNLDSIFYTAAISADLMM